MSDTVHARVRRTAGSNPGRTFCHFVDDDGTHAITSAELVADIDRFAAAFAAAGVEQEEPVVILLPHHPALYSSFLGAMAHGAVPSFMPLPSQKQDPVLYWRDHRALFERIGVRTAVTTAQARHELEAHLGLDGITVIDAEATRSGDRRAPGVTAGGASDRIALLQHSSGTTGLKKGVALSHRAVLDQIDRYGTTLGWSDAEVVVSWLPLYHDMGLIATFLLPAVLGGTIVSIDPFAWAARPTRQLDAIERHGGTRTWLPNFAFLHLARHAPPEQRWALQTMTSWVNCSEPCKPAAFDRFLDRFGPSGVVPESLQVCYAMAETVFAVTHAAAPTRLAVDADELAERHRAVPAASGGVVLLSCGPALADTAIRVVHDTGEHCPDGEVGEILVSGASLFDGYHRLPDTTAERLQDGWFRTGDLGFIRDDELYVTGRRDDLIIVYGRNYYAHDIEAIASDTPGVIPGRVVAFRQFNDEAGTHGVVVMAESDATAEARAVERALKRRVETAIGLQVQRTAVVPRGTLVKTTSGKISRRHNADRFAAWISVREAA